MSRDLLAHIFSSLTALEKCLEDSRLAAGKSPRTSRRYAHDFREQAKVIGHMRRTANKLQLELAHNDWACAVRSLHIYYGLNSLVRPYLMGTYATLHNTKNPFEAVQSQAVWH